MKKRRKEMRNKRRAPHGEPMQDSRISRTTYSITLLMCVTTLIAGWHIRDLWSGIVALLCGLITIGMVWEVIGGAR